MLYLDFEERIKYLPVGERGRDIRMKMFTNENEMKKLYKFNILFVHALCLSLPLSRSLWRIIYIFMYLQKHKYVCIFV